MNRELIINVTKSEITIALAEDKRLVQLSKESVKSGFSVGDIYLGKVRKIMPGLNAAFVNIGHEKDAFIHYLDLGTQFATQQRLFGQLTAKKRTPKFENIKLEQTILTKSGKVGELIKSGQDIVVQVAKEAISTKGPRLTADLSLAGRNVVLLPFTNKVSISQKIRSNPERKRLKKLADTILPRNYGVIIRTAAMGKNEDDLRQDILSLIEKWEALLAKLRTSPSVPSLLLGESSRATSIIRDTLNDTYSSIVVDDKELFEEIKEYIHTIAPDKEKIVKLYKGNVPMFDSYDLTRQIKTLFAKYVSLKRGAYLIIEHTEAMHVIDVNSGNRSQAGVDQEQSALEVNLAAAEEIARQLRLRDMGGIIIIDFIDLHKSENRNLLQKKMSELMSIDKAKHTVLPLSKFGLMQITRQRVRPEAVKELTEMCPMCGGTGKISTPIPVDKQIENRIAYLTDDRDIRELTLRVNPIVEAYLTRGWFSSIQRRWAKKYRAKLRIEASFELGAIEFRIFDRKGKELE